MKVEKFSIPSVFTYHWKGAEIVDLIKKHEPRKVHIALQEGSHCRTTSQVSYHNCPTVSLTIIER